MGKIARNRNRQPDEAEQEHEHEQLRRELLPVARAILWKPLPDSYHLLASMMRSADQRAQLFITQRSFLQVERHLRSAADLELGGFLAGHVCECPRSHVRYSIVNTVVPFADVNGEPIGSRVTQEGFEKVRHRLDAHRLSLIGWYRNGSGLGLQLLPDDVETHLTFFDKPWQTTMLVVPDPAKSKGAFFTYDPRVGRSYCIPFYELFDGYAAEAKRLDRTCVSWTTYVPSTPVHPLAAQDREIVETTVAPMRSEPEVEPPQPIDEWIEAIKDPWVRLKDVAAGSSRRDVPLPLVYESAGRMPEAEPAPPEPKLPPMAAPEPRPPKAAEPAARVSAPAQPNPAPRPEPIRPEPPRVEPIRPEPPRVEPIRSESPRVEPTRPEPTRPEPTRPEPTRAEPSRPEPRRPAPPFAGPARPASPRPVVKGPVPARPSAPRPAPAPRVIPPATLAAMERAAAPPPIALPPDFHDDAKRWERRRRIGFAVAAASFIAVIILSSFRPRSETVAQAATSAAASQTPAEAIVLASAAGAVPIPLESAVDSLSSALAYYRAIADDHRQGRVGCRVLDRAYALVGRARERVDASRGQVAGHLGDADSIRVSMLGAEYTHVAQTYRRSGCQA